MTTIPDVCQLYSNSDTFACFLILILAFSPIFVLYLGSSMPVLAFMKTYTQYNRYFNFVLLLQGTNNLLELLEKMNLRVGEEYKGFGDMASGLRVFVEQLKAKSGSFDEYVQQIDAIEQQVTEFEAVISMLDKYVSLLESKVQQFYPVPPS